MTLYSATHEDEGLVEEPGSTDAIELLAADHEDVKVLFADYEDLVSDGAAAADRALLAMQICNALTAHATIEEELLYPAAREAIGQADLLDQAQAEHDSAKALIGKIQRMDPANAEYDAIVMQLQDAVDHHVNEEESELFPRLRGSSIDLHSLGEQMVQRKDEVLDELEQVD